MEQFEAQYPTDIEFDFNILKQYNNRSEAKQYLVNRIIPLDNGNYCIFNNGKYYIHDYDVCKRVYLNKIDKELSKWFLTEYTKLYKVTYSYNKPRFFNNFINLAPPMRHTYNPTYEVTNDVDVKLTYVLNFIKDVLCSSKLDSYEFLLKWISNMLQGRKNQSAIYMKGPQGIGKSSLFHFLSRHVLGYDICVESGSDPLRTKFNEILSGKLLVCFEELENFSRAEWESISSTLKRIITSDNIILQNKCTKAYEAYNTNNYMICSNNDSIKDDDGRRYFILDLSTHMVGNQKYYSNLYRCFNDDVGEAFFHFVYPLASAEFNSQAFPITNNKIDSHTKRIDPVYKFIKEHYIFTNTDINTSAVQLYDIFKNNYDKSEGKMTKEDFHKKLMDVGFKRTKQAEPGTIGVSKKYWYNIPHKTLLEVANRKKWINDLDEYEQPVLMEISDSDSSIFSSLELSENISNVISSLDRFKVKRTELDDIINEH